MEVGNPLLFWKNRRNDFPVLTHVRRKYLTASASSLAVNVFHNGTHYEQLTFKAPAVETELHVLFTTVLIVELDEF